MTLGISVPPLNRFHAFCTDDDELREVLSKAVIEYEQSKESKE